MTDIITIDATVRVSRTGDNLKRTRCSSKNQVSSKKFH